MAREFARLTPEGKGILGHLDDDGVVTFAVQAGEGSSVRGTELFNGMMASFGNDARAVHGVWRQSPTGRPSTNIDLVNELTGAGMPLEEAVLQAWTVTRARKLGFTRVRVLGRPKGAPGAYTEIDVLLEKGPAEGEATDE
jgi:hypothetical protein